MIRILLILVIIIAVTGIVIGIMFYRNNPKELSKSKKETYNLTLQDMYCNIKESRKIAKVRITIETNEQKTLDLIEGKQFLIRDDINKIIRNKTEEELQGKEGHVALQKEIRESLNKLFDKGNITNIYFDDLIIQ
ncbi:MAG TPA: flagellar basal body-associated FliL family protein [Tepidimicrobium sp.]|nr:flagellar basal body-associated FliL family protein [Tepidimicrobium sp.]